MLRWLHVSLVFRLLGRSCHKLWRQFACASVVRDWIRRWLLANVVLGHKQDLTVPPTESDTRKTVSQRAALAPRVAHFSPARPLVSQTLAAIRVCKCRERLDSPMVACKRCVGTQTRPDSAPNGIRHQEDCFATCCVGSVLLIFRLLGRSCHKLWRQFACASVVRDWIRRWLLANVVLGHKQDLTVPPTESYTRKTVSQRAALAPSCSFFACSAARVTNSGGNSRVQVS